MLGQYREYRPPAPLRAVAACLWELAPPADHVQLVIPDGCVDLILMEGHGLVVAGADTERELTEAGPKQRLELLVAAVAARRAEPDPLIAAAGQAHMTDEVRRLTGATPVRFLEDAGLTAA
jgi:hypothetical protein